ncbi:hypothetical protein [Nocardiopsis algeriensis]|uniref:Uncharacterized protein n=1 Tax=Nocardiopsis algeriensis TaxID=1478215 RepID=A0A841INB3_9ACTN|nr:hypothetical protein [Nocardiopsis algeriensis]MBB6119542.1 hypothetical protein [Nocardiopsis algeriensis]
MSKTDNYLGSTRLDDIARMVTELASEVWILRDRNMVLEHLLAEKGAVSPEEIEELRPDGELLERIQDERAAFVRRVFGAVLDQEERISGAL